MTPRSLVENLLDEKPVIVRDKVIEDGEHVCPHCQQVIQEKSTFREGRKWIHGSCGGVIKLPPPSAEAIAWLEQLRHHESKGEPKLDVLKKNEVKLTDEERKEVFDAGATWHMNGDAKPSSGVHKAVVDGKTWFFCYTHRAYAVKPTLKGAINEFDFIESTS